MSRTVNSLRNAETSLAGQLLNNVMRFLCRTVFIYTLGKEYLGISSLYTNVLTILSISELGLGSAITFSLYKPLAEDDKDTIRSLLSFFKKAYRLVGISILGLGLVLMPFLPKLMTGVTDKVNIYAYYLLYLAQTVVSYLFFAYKATLLVADQKKYVQDLVSYAVQIVMNLVQIVILLLWRSFLAYTVAGILSNVVLNVTVALEVDRRYPYLKEEAKPLSRKLRRDVFSRVYAMSIYRVCTAVGTATDNLIISAYISISAAGMYDNYYMIVVIIQRILSGIFQAVTSSLGNLWVLESRERNAFMFQCLNLLNNWLIVFCSVCFLGLFQPFVKLCFGDSYLLSDATVMVIVFNFATNYLQNVVQIYKSASGLFVMGKYRAAATAVLNLGLSLWLVHPMGITGVLLASIISRTVTTWCYDGWLLFRKGFGLSPLRYYLESVGTLALILICYFLVNLFPVSAVTWPGLILRGMICALVSNGICLLLCFRSKEFHFLLEKGLWILKKRKK